MLDQTIDKLKYIKEHTEHNGLRIWRVSHKTDMVSYGDEQTFKHWYQLIYSERDLRRTGWTNWPLKDSFFKQMADGEFPEISLVFNKSESLALALKYGVQ